ncbi:MAG: insulinase family protein [candidate division WOR-3 bacterium]|nr:MAG: insulinase family protein [candidate division WOR-3 bacterium]
MTTRGGLISSEKNKITLATLNPAVRIIAEKIPKFYSFSMGVFINNGSRDESLKDGGITHLIEHMLFKGTSRKSALEIVKMMESLGGAFDAYTTKENLIIITKFLSEHITLVFELIAEILLESKIDSRDLNKEKSVVLEEIKSSSDDPGDSAFELFFRTLMPDHSLGRPIAGTMESVKQIESMHAKRHYRKLMNREIVIALSGNYDYDKIVSLANQRFAMEKVDKIKRTMPSYRLGKIEVQPRKEFSQVHFVFGTKGVEYAAPQHYQLSIMNTALGGGMSSRLFQGLREKDGLVYHVQSFIDFYCDCGVSGFYFICDKKNIPKVVRRLKTIFKDINGRGFSKEEIDLAKTYLSGNLLLSLESSTSRMLRLAREAVYSREIATVDDVVARINSVNEKEINGIIKDYFDPQRYTVAAVGPITEKDISSILDDLKT